jgi:hypothetical protein
MSDSAFKIFSLIFISNVVMWQQLPNNLRVGGNCRHLNIVTGSSSGKPTKSYKSSKSINQQIYPSQSNGMRCSYGNFCPTWLRSHLVQGQISPNWAGPVSIWIQNWKYIKTLKEARSQHNRISPANWASSPHMNRAYVRKITQYIIKLQ